MSKDAKTETSAQSTPGLRRNAVGLGSAVIMSAAIMGPAVSTFFNPQFSTPFSGAATPFVYALCMVAILITVSGIFEMSARLPSAGAFYTYVTKGLGPKAGFVTGALMFVAYALLPPAELGLIGSYLQTEINNTWGISIPWFAIGIVPALAMIFLAFEGIQTSLRTAMVLFIAEVAVVLVLAIIVVAHGGKDGLTVAPLLPSASPHGWGGILTGFVMAALSFVGFEAATTLGEEVRDPKRNVPRAMLLSVVGVGILYVFVVWAEVIGVGMDAANKLDGTSTPWNDLANTFAPWMNLLVVLAAVSSMFAVMVNSNNGIVRILHVMGREGMLPKSMSHIHEKHNTPTYAIYVQGAFTIVMALIVGAISGGLDNPVGGSNVYGYLGFVLTLGILPVYVLTNAAAFNFFRKDGSFKVIQHGVLPVLACVLMIGLLIGLLTQQTAAPWTVFPWVIVFWVVIMSGIALMLAKRNPERLALAGAVMAIGEVEEGHVVAHDPQL